MPAERLQKVMAQAGLGSRRSCETLIRQGRVRVNHQAANLGMRVDPLTDAIDVDGVRLDPSEPLAYIMLNKPPEVLCSLRSQGGRSTVRDLISSPLRLFPVGRLDADSEGLVLMTNDGAMAHRLTHPSFGHAKRYRVELDREPNATQLNRWRRGLTSEDGEAFGPAEVTVVDAGGKGHWIEVTLTEGKKRQIRRTAQVLGLEVVRLVRTEFAGLRLGRLAPGAWRNLTREECDRLAKPSRPSREGVKRSHGWEAG